MRSINVLKFLLETEAEDIISLKQDLDALGIDADECKKKSLEFIARRRAEMLIKKGKKLREVYEKGKSIPDRDNQPFDLRSAARNLEQISENDRAIISENFKRLRKLEQG